MRKARLIRHARGSGCSAGRSATAARRRSRTRRCGPPGSSTGATSCCRSRRSCWPRSCGRCRRRAFAAPTSRSRTSGPRSRSRPRRPSARVRSGPPTRSPSSAAAIAADNTDAPALIAALPIEIAGAAALVLGAGGAARAAVWALRDAGAGEIRVWNRTPERARELCAQARRHTRDRSRWRPTC